MTQYTVKGYDAHGNPVSETISIEPKPAPTWKSRARDFVARWIFNGNYPLIGVRLHNFGWRHGFHKWRGITSIRVKGSR